MSPAPDFSIRIGDVRFRNPFIVGSGPTVRDLSQLRRAEDSGWGGASIKLAIEPFPYISLPPRYRWFKKERYHIFTAEKRLSPDQALSLLEQSLRATRDLVVIPNLTYDGGDFEGWVRLVQRFVDAGARIVELNMCCPNMSFNVSSTGGSTTKHTGASLGNDLENLPKVVRLVADAVKVPVIVKLSADGGLAPAAALVAIKAGAAAVGHTGNLLGIPDIDIRKPQGGVYRLQDQLTLGCMSGAALRPFCLRTTYQMRQVLGEEPLILSAGGVTGLDSAVEHIMAGADALWVCTETMIRGFEWLPATLDSLGSYMKEMGFACIRDFRDSLHKNIVGAERLSVHPGLASFDVSKCTACGACWRLGHCLAISHPEGRTVVDSERCTACSTCVDVCPAGAFTMIRSD
jgi:dihydroorotate dehydrogenase/Pyruvate/2-oxoacid:ferredoxin oxidoreductase delta subunit